MTDCSSQHSENRKSLNDHFANAQPTPDAEPSNSLRKISLRWLAEIDAEQFDHCHEYLTAVRRARHMSKSDIVSATILNGDPRTGVSLPTVSKIESGTYGEPGFRTMVRLARAYGVPLSSLERFFK